MPNRFCFRFVVQSSAEHPSPKFQHIARALVILWSIKPIKFKTLVVDIIGATPRYFSITNDELTFGSMFGDSSERIEISSKIKNTRWLECCCKNFALHLFENVAEKTNV